MPAPTAAVVIGTAATGYEIVRGATEAMMAGGRFAKKLKLTLGEIGPDQMPNAVSASSSSVRIPRSNLPPYVKREVAKCCEGLFEEKYLPTVRAAAAVPTAATGGVVTPLNDFSQGTGPSARIGSTIKNQWLILKGYLILPATTGGDIYRLTIVSDHEAFGSQATNAQVFESQTVFSPPNFQARPRFRVLVDHTIPITNPTTPGAGASSEIKTFELKVPLGFKTSYNGNAGTIGDVVKNSVLVMEGSLSGNIQSAWQAHLIYTDA